MQFSPTPVPGLLARVVCVKRLVTVPAYLVVNLHITVYMQEICDCAAHWLLWKTCPVVPTSGPKLTLLPEHVGELFVFGDL